MLSVHIVGDAFADLLCFLENSLPVPGGDARIKEPIQAMAGGSAVNTITHLTSLDKHFHMNEEETTTVTLHTCINPNDDYGKLLLHHAAKNDFPLINCKRNDSNGATGHCVVIVTRGDRSFMSHSGCMSDFSAQDLNVESLVQVIPANKTERYDAHIHIAGYYNIQGFWNGKLQVVLERIRAERKTMPNASTTTCSLVPQHDATEQWNGGILQLLPLLDFLILNELEADGISRRNQKTSVNASSEHAADIEHWAAFFDSISPHTYIIVTLGAQGAVALQNGRVVATQPAVSIQLVDPTGAGDAFAAGFLHGIWDWQVETGRSRESDTNTLWPLDAIRQGLLWGCAVASCSVLTRGASVPSTREQIQEFLDNTAVLPK